MELRELVAEAAQSLARLDADRLEDMVLSCEELNRSFESGQKEISIPDPRGTQRDMAALAQVLEATRSNLAVINRLRDLHARRTEYVVASNQDIENSEVSDGIY
jgi:hypothetical protein